MQNQFGTFRKGLEATNKNLNKTAFEEGLVGEAMIRVNGLQSLLSCSSLNISVITYQRTHSDTSLPLSLLPNRRELHSQTRQSLPVVDGQSWEGHQRFAVFHVSKMK